VANILPEITPHAAYTHMQSVCRTNVCLGTRGWVNRTEQATFLALVEKLGVVITQCLLTHAHLDHVMGCGWVQERWGLAPRIHPLDEETYQRAPLAAQLYAVPMDSLPPPIPDLAHGMRVPCGPIELEVRWVPGHAPGHVVFVSHDHGWVVGGDVLFQGSVGRTDLPGCNPSDLVVWPGHGGPTNIGEEMRGNPFVNGSGSGLLQRETER
jgi:hydroxyacylglutathione hydrolase